MNSKIIKANIFSFKRFSVHDGSGIRQTVFFKGCPLNCWWCHNPESQNINAEHIIKKNIVDGEEFEQEEELGKLMSVDELMFEIKKDIIFYDESGGGVTFSGGEPLLQHQFLIEVLKECKKLDINTAIDTTGFDDIKIIEEVACYANTFLYDIKHMDDTEHQKYTGVSNKGILENLRYLDSINKNVVIRFPVIPNINDTKNNIKEMKVFLSKLKNIRKIDLLPYHNIANHKYTKFNKQNKMIGVEALSKEGMESLKKEFEKIGFTVGIGG